MHKIHKTLEEMFQKAQGDISDQTRICEDVEDLTEVQELTYSLALEGLHLYATAMGFPNLNVTGVECETLDNIRETARELDGLFCPGTKSLPGSHEEETE